MYLGGSNLPTKKDMQSAIQDYESALAFWKKYRKPDNDRGFAYFTGLKSTHIHAVRFLPELPEGEFALALQLYSTDLIYFYPDGKTFAAGDHEWSSTTTVNRFNAFSPDCLGMAGDSIVYLRPWTKLQAAGGRTWDPRVTLFCGDVSMDTDPRKSPTAGAVLSALVKKYDEWEASLARHGFELNYTAKAHTIADKVRRIFQANTPKAYGRMNYFLSAGVRANNYLRVFRTVEVVEGKHIPVLIGSYYEGATIPPGVHLVTGLVAARYDTYFTSRDSAGTLFKSLADSAVSAYVQLLMLVHRQIEARGTEPSYLRDVAAQAWKQAKDTVHTLTSGWRSAPRDYIRKEVRYAVRNKNQVVLKDVISRVLGSSLVDLIGYLNTPGILNASYAEESVHIHLPVFQQGRLSKLLHEAYFACLLGWIIGHPAHGRGRSNDHSSYMHPPALGGLGHDVNIKEYLTGVGADAVDVLSHDRSIMQLVETCPHPYEHPTVYNSPRYLECLVKHVAGWGETRMLISMSLLLLNAERWPLEVQNPTSITLTSTGAGRFVEHLPEDGSDLFLI